MKTTIKLIALIVAFFASSQMADAQSKQLEKALKKEYKTKMKEYQKEGWKIFNTSRSLDVALLLHYQKLNEGGDNVTEITGIATNFTSKNVGRQMAINNTCNMYARQAGSHVKGRIVSDIAANGDDSSGEFDHFYAAYESTVEREIRGEMRESYSIIRETGKNANGQPTYELQVFFIVDENAATQARIRAYENALRESEAAQRHAAKVSEFIREGFSLEEQK